MQKAITIAVFAFVVVGLGRAVMGLSRATQEKNPIVRYLETLGVGLAAFSFAGVVFALVGIPLHWGVYVGIAAVGWAAAHWVGRGIPVDSKWDRDETICAIALLALLVAVFALFLRGANAYEYLEDDDPWSHAQGALYVAKNHNCDVAAWARGASEGFAFYLEPYPPTYDIVMGVMRQLNDSISWTLKTFNVVLVTLAVAFNFLLGKSYLGNWWRALFAAFVLAVLPGYMSHFIYSQTLALCIFPVALYATMKAMRDRSFIAPAMLSVASMMVTQPVVSVCFAVVLLLFIALVLVHDRASQADGSRARSGLVVAAGGFLLSLLYWGRQVARWGLVGILSSKGKDLLTTWHSDPALLQVPLADALFPPIQARIDAPVGWGIVVALALLVGIGSCVADVVVLRMRASPERTHLLGWFLPLAYLGFAPALDLPAWGSARMWAYMAVPVAFLATEGIFLLGELALAARPRLRMAAIALAALGIALTCLPAKAAVETAIWPLGAEWSGRGEALPPEVAGYLDMKAKLPHGTRVYSFCGNGRSIGFDMDSSPWVESEWQFRLRSSSVAANEAIAFLDAHDYAYLTLDQTCWRNWGDAPASLLARGLLQSPRVRPVVTRSGFVLAELSR
jgi:hypothetical protein